MSLFDRQPKVTPAEDLPSLEETAQVPVTHSDKVHGEKNWQGIQETYRTQTARLAPEQTDEVLTGRKTADQRAGEVAKKNRLGHLGIAGLTAGVAATTIFGATQIFGNSNKTPAERDDRDEAGTSQSANQTEDIDPTTPAGTQEVGVAGTTFETINVKPTQEMIDEALEPVTVAEYPTPEAALERFGQIENVLYLSADVIDDGTSDFPETSESKERAIALLTNMLGDEASARDYYNAGSGGLRHIIGIELWFINETDTIENGKTGTWHGSWQVEGAATDQGSGAYAATVERTYETNFHEIDDMIYNNIPDIQSEITSTTDITLHEEDGVWSIDTILDQK